MAIVQSAVQTTLPIGSILCIRNAGYGFDHFGIFGIGADVVHACKDTGVTRDTFEKFAGNRAVEVVYTPRSPEEGVAIWQRGLSQVGLPYSRIWANCEHLVTWAVTGRAESRQLQGMVSLGVLAGLIALLHNRESA